MKPPMLPMYSVRDSVFKYQNSPNKGKLVRKKPQAAENVAAANVVAITIRLGPMRSLNEPAHSSSSLKLCNLHKRVIVLTENW
jgi:hypothetical protein